MRAQDIKYGPVYHFKDSHFYAASGSIVFHDNRKEDHCSILSVSTFVERAMALQAQLNHIGPQLAPGAVEHRRDLKRLLANMDSCIKDAREQGDPMDPAVQRWYKINKPWKGNTVSMVGSDGVATGRSVPVSYEVPMQQLPVGEFTGRTDRPGLVLPDASFKSGRR
jgi:hypothetical protein